MPKITLMPVVLLALTLPGMAQEAASSPTAEDRSFLTRATQGAVFELVAAKLASEKAVRPDVKLYAQRLVVDHATYNAVLRDLLKANGVVQPNDIQDAARATMAELEALSGPAFDRAYIVAAVRTNAEDRRDAETERQSTRIEAIKRFIQDFASMDAEHERLAKELEQANP